MKYFETIIMSAVSVATVTFTTATAQAQDDRSYFLIEQTQTHPTKTGDYMGAWKTIVEHAKIHDYKYTTYVSQSGPLVSTATPLSSYADIDALMAERERIYGAAGKDFEKAIEDLNAATFHDMTLLVRHLPDISNPPSDEDMANINMFELATLQIHPGHGGKFVEIMGKYKDGLDKAGLLGSTKYNVYAGGIGSGGAYYLQSFGKDAVDLAQNDAKIDAMFADNKSMQDLFGEYLMINRPGGYAAANKFKMVKDMAYFPDKE
ncbi:MAG: hypothetical protein HKN36_01120 [Hellea sp.]|nr:hypothetical protein [Hellea sp.]